ncbi:MAG: hypothetical protein KY455_10695 [Euryarchaeota archaeon]|nr:hypothetical protein [Euryarchaeota archaeon]
MEHVYILILTILKIISVSLGAIFLFFTYRAYRKHASRPLLVLMVAILLMVLAAVAEGAAFQVLGFALEQAHVIEAVFTLAAFAVLVWSILVPHRKGEIDITDLEEEDLGGPDRSAEDR